jgi:polysaccharide export outer membrane protein
MRLRRAGRQTFFNLNETSIHKRETSMLRDPLSAIARRLRHQAARRLCLGCAALLLASCAALPNSGPTEQQVLQSAQAPQNAIGYHIVPLTKDNIRIAGAPGGAMVPGFAGQAEPGPTGRIGVGDTLQISIFEAGNSLFAPSATTGNAPASGPTGAASDINLPPQQVDAAGDIFVPYAGRIRAAGASPQSLATRIEAALAGQSQNPQVMVSIAQNLANTVIVSGDVHAPGRLPLTLADERLSDIIAIAGGPTHDTADTTIYLRRNGQRAVIADGDLDADPAQDVVLMPGDRIELSFGARSFTVFGAAHVMQIPFGQANLTLADALARAGGPTDSQADPDGVFLFRLERPETAQHLGLPAADAPVPVIYQIDMLQPTSYFLAQDFAMRNGDLIYFANAKTNTVSKLFGLIGQLVAPAATGAVIH